MSIEISDVLKGGFRRVASRTGAILALGYFLVFAVYQVAYNSLLARLYSLLDIATPAPGPTLDVPAAAAGAVVLASLVAMAYLSVVAIRTFAAGSRSSFPDDGLSRNVPVAVGNMIAGGISLLLLGGLLVGAPVAVATVFLDGLAAVAVVLLVALVTFVAAVYLTVGLVFMPMYVAAEDRSFVAGFRRSWALTRGERLSVFLLYLVLVVLAVGVSVPVAIVGFVAVLGAGSGGMAVSQFLNLVVIAPLTMFQLAVFTVAFQRLRGDGPSGEGGAAASEAPTSPA